jgi:hypothetical protein
VPRETFRFADTQDLAFKPQAGPPAIPSAPAPVTSPPVTIPVATNSDDIFLITTFLLSFTTHVRSAEKFTGASTAVTAGATHGCNNLALS